MQSVVSALHCMRASTPLWPVLSLWLFECPCFADKYASSCLRLAAIECPCHGACLACCAAEA